MVLINGASGAVGLYAVEIAKSLGCKVIGVAGHDKGLALITGKGAIAISYKDADYVKKVKDAAGPRGVNLILETTSKNLPKDIDVLGSQGKVILIGDAAKETLDFQAVLQKELTIKATQAFSATPEQYKLMRAGLEKALKDGSIKPVVEKVYPINQIAQVRKKLMTDLNRFIDWLIDWVINWLIYWVIDWLIDWLSDRLIDWLIDLFIHVLFHWFFLFFIQACYWWFGLFFIAGSRRSG